MPLDGHGLARQERLVDRRGALLDDAVGRDLLARPHDEAITDRELGDRNEVLGAARIEHRRLLRAELEQGPQRGAGTPPRTRLEVPAGEDERRHDGRDLEVDPVVARRAREHHVEWHAHVRAPGPEKAQRDDRPAPCGERAETDQRVHRGRAMTQAPARPRGGTASPPRGRPASRAAARPTASSRTAATGSSRPAAPAARASRR